MNQAEFLEYPLDFDSNVLQCGRYDFFAGKYHNPFTIPEFRKLWFEGYEQAKSEFEAQSKIDQIGEPT